jgi:hypothetical protein
MHGAGATRALPSTEWLRITADLSLIYLGTGRPVCWCEVDGPWEGVCQGSRDTMGLDARPREAGQGSFAVLGVVFVYL